MATTYSAGQSIGSVFGSPLVVTATTAGTKVVTQVITAKDGKPGYIFRGSALMLAAKPAATKVSGFVDGDAAQFLASDAETGFTEPAGLVFSDLEFSYTEDNSGTRVWQKKSDVTASAIESVLTGTATASTARSASITEQITSFISTYWIYIALAIALYLVYKSMNSKGGRRKSKGFLGL